jgi:hypothetical protein
LTSESLKLLAKLVASNFLVRSLNLKSNGVGDESAHHLLAAVK